MPSSSLPKGRSPAPARSSRGASATSTRQRLVEATIDIVRSEGLGALTTVEITRRAGIAQPGFYKHFRNVDECLEEATKQVLDGMRETFSAMRRSIQDRNDHEEVARYCRAVLDAVAVDRPFNELIARYRRDTSALGRAIHGVEALVLDDFADELWGYASAAGLGDEHRMRVTQLARFMIAGLGACIERILDDPDADRAALAEELAAYMIGGTRAALVRLLGKAETPRKKKEGR